MRDVFVFCCHTGYAYKDAAVTRRTLGYWYQWTPVDIHFQTENDNVANVPLLDIASEIIDKYRTIRSV
ncbi:MAG: hypothetical protein IPN89_06525 [Saprospiraceae bacterium]|nr:hypothetical protein [Saprospiraceae bacterium]